VRVIYKPAFYIKSSEEILISQPRAVLS